MLVEGTLLALAVLTWRKLGEKPVWTPEHEEMYQNALEHLKGPAGVVKLRQIAEECERSGHHIKAFALRKRADLRSADAKTKAERQAAFEKGMASTNIEGILRLARAFEDMSATGAAKRLRIHAEEVQNPSAHPPVENAPPPPGPAAGAPPIASPPAEVAAAAAPTETPDVPEVDADLVASEPVTAVATPAARMRARDTKGVQEALAAVRAEDAETPLNGAAHTQVDASSHEETHAQAEGA